VFGYPFHDPLRFDHAFLERELAFHTRNARGLEGGNIDQFTVLTELEWPVSNRATLILEIPLSHRNLRQLGGVGAGEEQFANIAAQDVAVAGDLTGIGDMEAGLRFIGFNSRQLILAGAFSVLLPTGNDERGLGQGGVVLEPGFLGLYDFGDGRVIQTQWGVEVPLQTADVENTLSYNFAFSQTILATRSNKFFRWLTPFVELKGDTILNGAKNDRTVLELTPGCFWRLGDNTGISCGYAFPFMGSRDLDSELLLSIYNEF